MAAVVTGVAIRPGVSKNGRRYTAEAVRRAYKRLSDRLSDPTAPPITMRAWHPKPNGHDATVEAIAGRVTSVSLAPDGSLHYRGLLADTPAGKTVTALLTPDAGGRRHLGSVSIRGYAHGETARDADGNDLVDDLEVVGVDFTDNPGVDGATAALGSVAATESADPGRYVTESLEAPQVTDGSDSDAWTDLADVFRTGAVTQAHYARVLGIWGSLSQEPSPPGVASG